MKTNLLVKCILCLTITVSIEIAFVSCQKERSFQFPDPDTLPKGLIGSWVETTTGADTISFNSDKDSGYFNLYRG
jgi:hypothetical protein